MSKGEAKSLEQRLQEKFLFKDLEFRPARFQRLRDGRIVTEMLTYITARAVQQRLDDLFGLAGWRASYEWISGGCQCLLSVKVGEEWIAKADFAETIDKFPVKGTASDAFKRAAVQFGIGRYLYSLESAPTPVYDKPTKAINEVRVSGKIKSNGQDTWVNGYVLVPLTKEMLLAEEYEVLTGAKEAEEAPAESEQQAAPVQTS